MAGTEALGTEIESALLEAGYVKARVEDARERYRLGDVQAATEITRGLFESFEADRAGFHETLEEIDEALYETFEDEHLRGLIQAFEDGDETAIDEHVTGIRETILSFEAAAGSTAHVSAVESGYMAARVFDATVLEIDGDSKRAAAVLQATLQHFEAGAGGFHEVLETVDHDQYEAFEAALEAAISAAHGDGTVGASGQTFAEHAVDAMYTVVASAGDSARPAATSHAEAVFADFEEARVHDMLEDADHDTYETFEATLNEYINVLESGSGVTVAAEQFATAALGAQFAVAGVPELAPDADLGSADDHEGDPELEGGPNVVEGVPEDADHVVEMQAVAFEPEELTIQQGETVAWTHAAGEPHSVTAIADGIPDAAAYWASGDFESESRARDGWETGHGAVQSGQSYVKTFETTGEHEYLCIPHEAAGMVGTVIVE